MKNLKGIKGPSKCGENGFVFSNTLECRKYEIHVANKSN